MREGINDKVLAKIMGIQGRAIEKVVSQLKGEKPFSQIPLSPDEKLWAIDNLGYSDMGQLISEFGEDKMNKLLYEAHQIRQRRQTK